MKRLIWRAPVRARVWFLHGLVVMAGAALVTVCIGAAYSHSAPRGRAGATASPAPPPNLSGFALELQDWADTARASYGGPKVRVIDCIQGGPGDFFCAFIVKRQCHASHVLIEHGDITPTQSGRIGISPAKCSAANALHWIGTQNA